MPFFDTKDVGSDGDGDSAGRAPTARSPAASTMAGRRALEDVGPAGVDKGKGGKYLILPPGYKGTAPDGYIVLQSPTLRQLRLAALQPRERQRRGRRQGGRLRQARSRSIRCRRRKARRRRTFVDAIDVVFDSTIPYDLRFFQALDRFVQSEPWIDRDRAMIDMLKSIGIEKGKTFDPDRDTQARAEGRDRRSARLARQPLRSHLHDTPSTKDSSGCFRPRRKLIKDDDDQLIANPNAYPVDGRGVAYSMAFFSAKHLGAGQYYLMTIRDKDRKPLRRQRHLPAQRAGECAGQAVLVGDRL